MASPEYTIGIICPLSRELAAVRATYGKPKLKKERDEENEITYYPGIIANRYAVAVCLPHGDTGLETAGSYAARLESRYPSLKKSSSLRFLCGIAGGNPDAKHDIRLGDVVVGTKIVNYAKGKITADGKFEASDLPYDAPPFLLDGLNSFSADNRSPGKAIRKRIEEMNDNHREYDADAEFFAKYPGSDKDLLFDPDYKHRNPNELNCGACNKKKVISRSPRQNDSPDVHYGLIACANTVLKDGYTRQHLSDYFNSILAVEMEASALKRYNYIVIRGISDYADTHKNDEWQDYAAAGAAAFMSLFVDSVTEGEDPLPKLKDDLIASPPIVAIQPETPSSPLQSQTDLSKTRSTIDQRRLSRSPTESHSDQSGASSRLLSNKITNSFEHDSVTIDVAYYGLKGKGQEYSERFDDASITLYEHQGREHYETTRKLVFSSNGPDTKQSRSLWLPLAHLRVQREDSTVIVKFPNCNGLGYKTQYGTQQGVKNYQATFNPKYPNVRIEMTFSSTDAAREMANLLLYLDSDIPSHRALDSYQGKNGTQLRLDQVEEKGSKKHDRIAILAWTLSGHKELDVAYLGKYLDFELRTENQETEIVFKLLEKIHYIPEERVGADWPTEGVIENEEGGPTRIKLKVPGRQENIPSEGNTGHRSGLHDSMTVKLETDQAIELFNSIVRGWTLMTSEFRLNFRPSSSRIHKSSFDDAQVTMWSKNSSCRILVRTTNPSLDKITWLSYTLNDPKSKTISEENLQPVEISTKRATVTLKSVDQVEGDYVARPEMLPVSWNAKQSSNSSIRTVDQPFEFNDREDFDRFQDMIRPFVNKTLDKSRSFSMNFVRSSTWLTQSGKGRRSSESIINKTSTR